MFVVEGGIIMGG